MEIPRFLKNLLGRREASLPEDPGVTRKKEQLQAQYQIAREQSSREALIKIYTAGETGIEGLAASAKGWGTDVESRRLAHEMNTNLFGKGIKDMVEQFETRILSTIDDPQKRHDLQVDALESARTYWEQALTRPDNSTDVTMMSRRRLTQISGKLEKIGNDPNQPNKPQP